MICIDCRGKGRVRSVTHTASDRGDVETVRESECVECDGQGIVPCPTCGERECPADCPEEPEDPDQPIRRICGWCKRALDGGPPIDLDSVTTHGICDPCAARFRAGMVKTDLPAEIREIPEQPDQDFTSPYGRHDVG